MSFVTRLWNAIRNPIRCVGRDLEGNRFYERSSPNDSTRTRRSIQYRDPEDMWKYTGGGKRLPIQWSAWLAHTRPHPPTIEELQADVARQQRVLANVALIEARDRAEDQERMRIRQEDAQRALQRALSDVSSPSNQGPASQDTFADSPNAAVSDEHGEQNLVLEGKVKNVASPMSNLSQANGPKIRPPAFLTPAKSLKSQTTKPISPSVFTPPQDISRTTMRLTQGAFTREHQCQRNKAVMESVDATQSAGSDSGDIQTQKSRDGASRLPVMPPRVAETESWAPKARARG